MKLHLSLIVVLTIVVNACDYSDNRLCIRNASNHPIAFDYSLDTTLAESANDIQLLIRDKILPGKTVRQDKPGSTQAWIFLIQNSNNKKLNVFIFDVDTVLKYNNLEYVRTHRLYKRYEFTEQELERMNWTVEYP